MLSQVQMNDTSWLLWNAVRTCNAKCNMTVRSLSEREVKLNISTVRLLVLLFITVLC